MGQGIKLDEIRDMYLKIEDPQHKNVDILLKVLTRYKETGDDQNIQVILENKKIEQMVGLTLKRHYQSIPNGI